MWPLELPLPPHGRAALSPRAFICYGACWESTELAALRVPTAEAGLAEAESPICPRWYRAVTILGLGQTAVGGGSSRSAALNNHQCDV